MKKLFAYLGLFLASYVTASIVTIILLVFFGVNPTFDVGSDTHNYMLITGNINLLAGLVFGFFMGRVSK